MTPACRRRIQVCFLASAVAWPGALLAQQPAQPTPAPAGSAAKAAAPKNQAGKAKPAKAAAKPKPDAAAAQNEVEAGIAALGQGKNDAAVANLSTALGAGSLPPAQTSRALYYRGVAYRRQAKPAQAISDLTNALWIKNGLSEEQRADALQQRAGAYREAGLPEQGDPVASRAAAAPKTAGPGSKTGSAQTPFAAVAPPSPSASSGSGGSIGGFFGSIFGGSTASDANPPAAVAAAPVSTGSAAPQRPSSPPLPIGFQSSPGDSTTFYQGPSRSQSASQPQPAASGAGTVVAKSWSGATEVKPAANPAGRTKSAALPAAPAAAAVAAPVKAVRGKASGGTLPAGNIQVQVAAVRSAKEAQGVASRLQTGFARELGGRAPVVDQTTVGTLGTIYRVQVGPFASARDTDALCAKLKGEGMDCRIVSQ